MSLMNLLLIIYVYNVSIFHLWQIVDNKHLVISKKKKMSFFIVIIVLFKVIS